MTISFYTPQKVYAAWRKDEKARSLSSSGGLASAISENWVKNGGIVYGAAFVKPFDFRHIRCSSIEELAMLRGSKYVQSSIKGVISLIKDDLKNGRKVLFTGTPCQVASMKACFGETIHTIEVICHGTPKQETLYASIPKDVLKLDFDRVDFRHNNDYKISFKKNSNVVWERSLSHDLYMKGFFKALFYRDCCYSCSFAKVERTSDITLGDFWGVDLSAINASIEKGCSLVFVNNNNGEELFNSVKDDIEFTPRPLAEAVASNQPLQSPMSFTWRQWLYKKLYPIIGFKWACILCMPDVVIKNLFR